VEYWQIPPDKGVVKDIKVLLNCWWAYLYGPCQLGLVHGLFLGSSFVL